MWVANTELQYSPSFLWLQLGKVIIASAALPLCFGVLFCVCVCSYSNHKHSQIFKFVTLKTETNTCHLLIYFMRANLAKLGCVLTSRFYLTPPLIFLFFSSIKAERLKDTLAFPLCRWYSRVSGDQASRETSPSMMSRWRKESVETHRPVSSTAHPSRVPLIWAPGSRYTSPRPSRDLREGI